MELIQKFAAVNLLAALIATGVPAVAAQNGYHGRGHGGEQRQSVDRRRDRQGYVKEDHHDYDRDRGFRDEHGYPDRHGYHDSRDYTPAYGYRPAPVYSAPVYRGSVYENGYDYDYGRSHHGRTAAIIGGSAAAGAVIGSAAGRGQGAVLGAVIGGIAGVAVNAAVDHDHGR